LPPSRRIQPFDISGSPAADEPENDSRIPMPLGRALLIGACLVPLAAGMASAQQPDPFGSAPPQQGGPDPFGSPPRQSVPDPFGSPPRQSAPDPFAGAPAAGGLGGFGPPPQQQAPPCVVEFGKLRDDAAKKAQAIQRASQNKTKVPPKEACHLFTLFSGAEEKMLKYMVAQKTSCGIPDEVIKQIRSDHARTSEIRTKICQVAEAPPRPAGPSLSDTLTSPVPDSRNIRSGSGTFDTLTGNPLGK
jgi:hypothetical protein